MVRLSGEESARKRSTSSGVGSVPMASIYVAADERAVIGQPRRRDVQRLELFEHQPVDVVVARRLRVDLRIDVAGIGDAEARELDLARVPDGNGGFARALHLHVAAVIDQRRRRNSCSSTSPDASRRAWCHRNSAPRPAPAARRRACSQACSGYTVMPTMRRSLACGAGAPWTIQSTRVRYSGESTAKRRPPPCAIVSVGLSSIRLWEGSMRETRRPVASRVRTRVIGRGIVAAQAQT